MAGRETETTPMEIATATIRPVVVGVVDQCTVAGDHRRHNIAGGERDLRHIHREYVRIFFCGYCD